MISSGRLFKQCLLGLSIKKVIFSSNRLGIDLAIFANLPMLFFYQDIEMSGVSLRTLSLCHGKASIKEIWPRIEILNREVFKLSQKEILANPAVFYDKCVEIMWLMGHLTPMIRGNGSDIEQWFVFMQLIRNLNALILKTELQLDALDLIFTVPIYQKLFLAFFEPNSLPSFALDDYQKQSRQEMTARLLEYFQLETKDILACERKNEAADNLFEEIQDILYTDDSKILQSLDLKTIPDNLVVRVSTFLASNIRSMPEMNLSEEKNPVKAMAVILIKLSVQYEKLLQKCADQYPLRFWEKDNVGIWRYKISKIKDLILGILDAMLSTSMSVNVSNLVNEACQDKLLMKGAWSETAKIFNELEKLLVCSSPGVRSLSSGIGHKNS